MRPSSYPTCTPGSDLFPAAFPQKDTDTVHTAEFLKSLKGPQTSDSSKWPQGVLYLLLSGHKNETSSNLLKLA